MSQAYKKSGVNLEAGYESVERIQSHVEATMRKGAMNIFGDFGGAFDLSELAYEKPVLVSGTDGVGTKLKLAFELDKHDTIGIDVVAMCVNDVLTQGAEPLFFLDYIACSQNIPTQIESIVQGVANGCIQAGAALLGGETAEMPGMYSEGEYDIAGFTVGVVEKDKQITKENVRVGDSIIGINSSGVHSNGFSLVRHIIAENNLDLAYQYDGLPGTLGEILLEPTHIYVKEVMKLLESVDVHTMAHITGGGFYENVPRMLPRGMGATFEKRSWPIPAIFPFLAKWGRLTEKDLFQVFNMGIGFMVVVDKEDTEKTLNLLGHTAQKIGIITNTPGVTI